MARKKIDHEKQNDEDVVSKSQLKREMHHLQDLGKQLLDLKNQDLEGLGISDELHTALIETKRIKHREGLRRQMQFIGKLMRKEGQEIIDAIEAHFEKIRNLHNIHNQQHHLVEQWRDRILTEGHQNIEAFIEQYADADRQWFRQIARQSAHETKQNKPPASARKLFVYLRDTIAKQDH